VSVFRFDCVFYYVSDLDRSVAFYTGVLGFRLSTRDVVARFHVDGILFELVPTDDPALLTGRGNARLALEVDDIIATLQQLRAKGVRIADARRVSNGHLAFLYDPDGNEICVWQYA
jgi:catechol 2,3-dioxygenase-like lactoylglutathione lyase family enzyme